MRKNERGLSLFDTLVVMFILATIAALTIPLIWKDSDEPSGTSGPAVHQAVPVEPSPEAVRAFVAEAKFDSCLPPDWGQDPKEYGTVRMTCPVCLHPEQRQDCMNSPWTPERQRQYCEERLEPGNPHIDYCSMVKAEWAFPTLLLAKLPELIERICNDDAEHLRKRYDEVIDEFWRAVRDRERAGLRPIYDDVLWFRDSEEIVC